MTKADFVKRVARAGDLTNDQATRAVQAVLDELELALKAGDEVQFSGFGKFSVSNRAAREGVDPRNPGNKIQIPARKVPRFSAGAQLKRMFFFDGGAIGGIGHEHGFTQMLGGSAGVSNQVFFKLLQSGFEKRQLRCIHIVFVTHLEELFLSEECAVADGWLRSFCSSCHVAYFRNC